MFTDFFLSSVLNWLPKFFFWAIFLIALFVYIKKQNLKKICSVLIKASISFRFLYALLLTIGQYFVWSGDPFLRVFLRTPLDSSVPLAFIQKLPLLFGNPIGYFLFYSWGRFWLNFFITLVIALVFWVFLRALKKHRERFFEEGEVELGFLAALIVGWPGFLVFLSVAFVVVVLSSLVRNIFWREKYTTLGYPFLFAALVSLLFGEKILTLSGLWMLKV